jgi:hypothetical protein
LFVKNEIRYQLPTTSRRRTFAFKIYLTDKAIEGVQVPKMIAWRFKEYFAY